MSGPFYPALNGHFNPTLTRNAHIRAYIEFSESVFYEKLFRNANNPLPDKGLRVEQLEEQRK
jgi:hypothetical protein